MMKYDEILGFTGITISHLCGFILHFRHVVLGAEDGDDVRGHIQGHAQDGEEQSSHGNPWPRLAQIDPVRLRSRISRGSRCQSI